MFFPCLDLTISIAVECRSARFCNKKATNEMNESEKQSTDCSVPLTALEFGFALIGIFRFDVAPVHAGVADTAEVLVAHDVGEGITGEDGVADLHVSCFSCPFLLCEVVFRDLKKNSKEL